MSFTVAGPNAITQSYDRAGNVTSEGRNLANAPAISGDAKTGTLSYAYDRLNRLTGSSGAGGTRSYRSDLDGDRIATSDPTRTTDRVYDRTDQLVSATSGSTSAAAYDPFGNLTAKPEDDGSRTALAYDAANRLTTITPASGSAASFSFDALGRITTRVVGANTDTYGYLGPTETVTEVATAGGTPRTIDAALGSDGSRLALKDASSFGWSSFDLHADLAALENQAMTAVSDALRYDGYGQTIDADGSFGSPWKYQGALDLAPNSQPLYDLGARMYAPSLGAFTSLDSFAGSAADPLSLNRFLYAEANPSTLIDPTGHYAITDEGDVCAACVPGSKPTNAARLHYKRLHHVRNRRIAPADIDEYSSQRSAAGGAAPPAGGYPDEMTKTFSPPRNRRIVSGVTVPSVWLKEGSDSFRRIFDLCTLANDQAACAEYGRAEDQIREINAAFCSGYEEVCQAHQQEEVLKAAITLDVSANVVAALLTEGLSVPEGGATLLPLTQRLQALRDRISAMLGRGARFVQSEPSSYLLGRNLEAAGFTRPADAAAHHIVAGADYRAEGARGILIRFGIDINSEGNGVFLPKSSAL